MSQKQQPRDIVLPGDMLYEGRIRTGENTYRVKDHVYATRMGLVNYDREIVYVVPFKAGYSPVVGDVVIGKVIDIELGAWIVDLGVYPPASLSIPDAVDRPYRTEFNMIKVMDVGDTVIAKIVDLDRRRTPILSILGPNLGKAHNGFIIRLTSSKVPRLIGKKGSMINMIIRETGCKMAVGQNGCVLVSGFNAEKEEIVVKVVDMLEREAHTHGLTNRIQDYIKKLKEK